MSNPHFHKLSVRRRTLFFHLKSTPLSMCLLECLLVVLMHYWPLAAGADLAGLLLAQMSATSIFAYGRLFLCGRSSGARWLLIGCILLLTAACGTFLQMALWPGSTERHARWLIPLACVMFNAVILLPHWVRTEIGIRTRQAVAAEAHQHKIEKSLLEAKLAALQGQIEPHFLYNTLAHVLASMHRDGQHAKQMLNHLIAYLRAAIPDLRISTTSLKQELDRATAYLQIMQLRMGERLQFEIHTQANLGNCLIPPLSLMTLVENAVKHGLEPLLSGGKIDIFAYCCQEKLHIEVRDNGAGISQEFGDGIGLLNLQERLQVLYGDSAEFKMMVLDTGGVSAQFQLPLIRNREDECIA
jgi:signal transduction histidine kinase